MAQYMRKRGPFRKYGSQHCDDHKVYMPTEDEIANGCEEIRDKWSENEKLKRTVVKPCPVEFKIIIDGKKRIKRSDHEQGII